MSADTVSTVRVDAIRPNPWNRHREPDADFIQSVRDNGLLQPIVVRESRDGFQIIAGERRWKAAKEIGMEFIPAIVRDADDVQARELCLIENVMRENLTPIEEAKEIAVLLELHHGQVPEVAARLGRSRQFIRSRSALANLDLEMLDASDIDVNSLPVACQELLAKVPQSVAQNVILENPWAVRDLYRLQAAVQGLTHSVENAPWEADDAELLPAAGSCAKCRKRTGADPDLFGKVRATVDEGDFCLDRDCYAKKERAYVESVERREVEKTGRQVVRVAYDVPQELYAAAKAKKVAILDAPFRSDYESCKRGTPLSVRAVVWCGKGAGSVVTCRPVAEEDGDSTLEERRAEWVAEAIRKQLRSALAAVRDDDRDSWVAAMNLLSDGKGEWAVSMMEKEAKEKVR